MILAVVPIFLGAFLLFMVQPLLAQRILPWFGGGASVWLTCLVFFQSVLLLGYLYADCLNRLPYRIARILHCFLLLVTTYSVYKFSLLPEDYWKPSPGSDPIQNILKILGSCIGMPFFILSTTSSLLQTWLALHYPGKLVHRWFAFSNMGSLAALLTYPFVFEVYMTLGQRAYLWKLLFLLYTVSMLLFILRSLWLPKVQSIYLSKNSSQRIIVPSKLNILKWVTFSGLTSLILSSGTYHLTQDIAPVPLLWVYPLSLYLLSFIFAFILPELYKPRYFVGPLSCVLILSSFLLLITGYIGIQLLIYGISIFLICYVLHAEIVISRPHELYLSRFYLAISFGGVIGVLLTGIIAPLTIGQRNIFFMSLMLVGIVLILQYSIDFKKKYLSKKEESEQIAGSIIMLVFALIVTGGVYLYELSAFNGTAHILFERKFQNFYASLMVRKIQSKFKGGTQLLLNGNTLHGWQIYDPLLDQAPLYYYHTYSGIGMLLNHYHPKQRRLGVIGLGAGGIAVYAEKGESIRFYDINPFVKMIAENYFTYLDSARKRGVNIEVITGDGRLEIEKEIRKADLSKFDVLMLDAFNSDAIPVHLLTEEAILAYMQRIKPDGVIAIHISHRHIDLAPVIARVAQKIKWQALIPNTKAPENKFDRLFWTSSTWVILTNNPTIYKEAPWVAKATAAPLDPEVSLWRDDRYSFHCLWKDFPCQPEKTNEHFINKALKEKK